MACSYFGLPWLFCIKGGYAVYRGYSISSLAVIVLVLWFKVVHTPGSSTHLMGIVFNPGCNEIAMTACKCVN